MGGRLTSDAKALAPDPVVDASARTDFEAYTTTVAPRVARLVAVCATRRVPMLVLVALPGERAATIVVNQTGASAALDHLLDTLEDDADHRSEPPPTGMSAMSKPADVFPPNADREDVYDNEVAPLMTEIIAICQRAQIPMLASFDLTPKEGDRSFLCTTLFGGSETLQRMFDGVGREPSVLALTIAPVDKSDE